jgi:hypothetical protein
MHINSEKTIEINQLSIIYKASGTPSLTSPPFFQILSVFQEHLQRSNIMFDENFVSCNFFVVDENEKRYKAENPRPGGFIDPKANEML